MRYFYVHNNCQAHVNQRILMPREHHHKGLEIVHNKLAFATFLRHLHSKCIKHVMCCKHFGLALRSKGHSLCKSSTTRAVIG